MLGCDAVSSGCLTVKMKALEDFVISQCSDSYLPEDNSAIISRIFTCRCLRETLSNIEHEL